MRVYAHATGIGTEADTTLLARASVDTLSAYAFSVDNRIGVTGLARVDGNVVTQLTGGGFVIPEFESLSSYFLEFLVRGDNLTGNIYAGTGDITDAGVGDLLISIQATDSTYTSGVSGVAVSANSPFNLAISSAFDDVSSTAIPEPGGLLLVVFAVAGFIVSRRRDH